MGVEAGGRGEGGTREYWGLHRGCCGECEENAGLLRMEFRNLSADDADGTQMKTN